jgi:hypothetical protein
MAKRNRVIYQSEALFVSKQYSGHIPLDIVNATHWSSIGAGGAPQTDSTPTDDPATIRSGHYHQLHRVQSANYNFAINRQDVNQFGNLARIDTAVIDAPTVGLDFSYLITDGSNEDKLGITVTESDNIGCLSGLLADTSGRNYHIVTVAEGEDANNETAALSDVNTTNKSAKSTSTIISIGNGFVTNYSMNASVGSIPTASVSVEGMNITAQPATTGFPTPSINPSTAIQGTATCTLPNPVSGTVGQILRPGDIQVHLSDSAVSERGTGLLVNLADTTTKNSAHIQSFNIDVPLGRSTINRLGTVFGFSKEVDFPIQVSVSISAIVADLKAGNLFDELFLSSKNNMAISMKKPAGDKKDQIKYILKNVSLDSESFSSSIGDNKTVDLSFSATVGGADDNTNGVFISGTQIPNPEKSAD